MLQVYRIDADGVAAADAASIGPRSTGKYWMDLLNPDEDDRLCIERARGVSLPTMADLREIEATSRYFVDDDGVHIRTWFIDWHDNGLNIHSVGFIINDGCLISLRSETSESFERLQNKPNLGPGSASPMGVFLRLVEIHLDMLADRLESLYANIESHWPKPEAVSFEFLDAELGQISAMGAENNKARFALMDLELVLGSIEREDAAPAALRRRLDGVRRDVKSLLNHSGFLSEKLDFLMDTVMTRLNLADNRVGKVLSVVALIFLPPTLIGSIYGMNFHHMPELDVPWAYPAVLVAMAVSAVVPYLLLKWKRWL